MFPTADPNNPRWKRKEKQRKHAENHKQSTNDEELHRKRI